MAFIIIINFLNGIDSKQSSYLYEQLFNQCNVIYDMRILCIIHLIQTSSINWNTINDVPIIGHYTEIIKNDVSIIGHHEIISSIQM